MNKFIVALFLLLILMLSGCDLNDECIEVLDDETMEYKQYCEDDDYDNYHYYRTYSSYRSVKKSSSSFKAGGPGTKGK